MGWPNVLLDFGEDYSIDIPREAWPYIVLYFDFEVAHMTALHFYDWAITPDLGGSRVQLSGVFADGNFDMLTEVGDLRSGHFIGSATLEEILANNLEVAPSNHPDAPYLIPRPWDDDVFTFAGLRLWLVGGGVTFREFRLVDTGGLLNLM